MTIRPSPVEIAEETALRSQFEEDVFAEVAACNMAIVKAMALLALSSDRRPYLSGILEAGLLDLEKMDYPNIPNDRRAAILSKIKARYADLITTIPTV